MLRYTLRNLRANLTRLVATGTAVVLGIGFLAAGLMLTDAMQAGLAGNVEEQYAGIDLAVAAFSPESGGIDLGLLVPAEVLDTVRSTDGVAAAAGELTASVRVLDDSGGPVDLRTTGRVWIDDDEMNPLTIVEGRAPATDDEVVLDVDIAEQADRGPGDAVTLRTPTGEIEATVVGTSRFGDQDALDAGGTVSFTQSAAPAVLGSGTSGWTAVVLRVDGEPSSVAGRLRDELPGSVEVLSAEAYVERQSAAAAEFLGYLRPVLQGFAYLSLFVCSFVIFNTFSVVVAQRARELALVRAVGGTPGQVRRSLLLEGLGMGVIASAIGIVAGALFTALLQWVLGFWDVALPGSGVRLSVWTVVICLFFGTLVTVLSVLVPAFRAGRTKPVEAMRSAAVDTSGSSRVRAVVGAVALGLSLVLLTVNQLGAAQWYWLAPGAVFLFVGLVVGGPLLARSFARAMTWPMSRLGLTGRLASDNASRNPKRTATTANALVIGLFLVTLVTVAGEAIKTALVSQLDDLSGSDYMVVSESGLDEQTVAGIQDTDGVTAATPVRTGVTSDGRSPIRVSTADLDDLQATTGMEVTAGSLDRVRAGEAMALGDFGALFGAADESVEGGIGGEQVGDAFSLRDMDGEYRRIEISALVDIGTDALFLGGIVDEATFLELVGEQPVSYVFVRVDPGRADATGLALDSLLAGHTGVTILAGNFLGQTVGQVFDFLIGAVNALLGMSVVIALVGIVNTMTLSIFERRHELGLVRALGMTRRQVGRMIRLEAVLIGLLGTIIGVAAGVLLGWVVVSSIGSDIDFTFNWARVALIVVVGLSVGVLAAIIPTRRATRIDMLEAMRSE